MKTLWLILSLFAVATGYGQSPTTPAEQPFRFNFQVHYPGGKAHPELAASLYKSLRALSGIGIVDRDPDAVLVVSENMLGNQYACSFTILTPQTPWLRLQLQSVLSCYDSDQAVRESDGESQPLPIWRTALESHTKRLPTMYSYEGGLVSINPSAKTALALAVKSLDVGFVEKQRREYDYSLAHPVTIFPIKPPPPVEDDVTPTPAPKPTPEPWTPPSRDFQLHTPTATAVPALLGPDPFPSKR